MNKAFKGYFTIGEFAKMSKISKQTLIFYDNEGILKPKYKDENNYRYYTIDQLETMDIIISLREIGVPLKKIKNYEQNKNPQACIDILDKERLSIETQIKNLKTMKSKIEDKIKSTKEGIKLESIKNPYIEEQEKQYLVIHELIDVKENQMIKEILEFWEYLKDKKVESGYSIGAIISLKDIQKKDYQKLKYLYVKTSKNIRNKKSYIKEEGLYANIIHKGAYDKTSKTYKKLLKYIDEQGYKITGNSYEESLLDTFSVESEDEYITKISIPIEKKED